MAALSIMLTSFQKVIIGKAVYLFLMIVWSQTLVKRLLLVNFVIVNLNSMLIAIILIVINYSLLVSTAFLKIIILLQKVARNRIKEERRFRNQKKLLA